MTKAKITHKCKLYYKKCEVAARRKRFATTLLICAVLGGVIFAFSNSFSDETESAQINSDDNVVSMEFESDDENNEEELVLELETEPEIETETESPNYQAAAVYPVTKVVDGDTIWVDINGVNTKVRFIGVNTPETVSPSKPVQCYGAEASNYVKNLLSNKSVGLEGDATQGDADYYGRLLRYVYVDGENLNFLLIKNGYGFEYTYDSAYKYQSLFQEAEDDARNNLRGLWSPATCDGELKSV